MQWIDEIAAQKRIVPGFIDFMTSNGSYIWSTNQDLIQKWSNEQIQPLAEIHVSKAAGIPVYAFDAVWAASLEDQAVYKIHAYTNQVLARIPTGLADLTGEFSLAASDDAIWVISQNGKLARIHPVKCTVELYIDVLPYSYNLSFAAEALWLSNTKNASVQRIDPDLNQVTHTITVDDKPWFLSATKSFVWTLNQTNGTVSKIDTQKCEVVATIQLPEQAKGDGGDIFATKDRVWVRTTHVLLIEIDAQTNQIIREIQHTKPAGSGAVMQCGNHLLITAHDIETVWLLPI